MTDNKLCEVLNLYNEIMVEQYSSIDKSEYHTFSDNFNKKMKRVIRLQKKPYYFAINTHKKRAILIVALITALMLTACSIPAIREPIVNFVTDVYESFTTLFFSDNSNEVSNDSTFEFEKASITIPKGYTVKETSTEFSYFLEMKSDKNDIDKIITFEQIMLSDTQMSIDTEDTVTEDIDINGYSGVYYQNKGYNVIIWSDFKYSYMLSGNITKNELCEIANTIK